MQYLLFLFLTLIAPLVSTITYASDNEPEKQYQVELIIFSQITTSGISQEIWDQKNIIPIVTENSIELIQPNIIDASLDQPEDTIDYLSLPEESLLLDNNNDLTPQATTGFNNNNNTDPTNSDLTNQSSELPSLTTQQSTNADTDKTAELAKPQPFTILPEDSWTLADTDKKLQQHSDYHILLHTAWMQPLNASKHPYSVHFFGGAAYTHKGDIIALDPELSYTFNSEPQWQVNGTISIELDRYINAHLNILFAMPTDQFSSLNTVKNNPTEINTHSNFTYIPLNQTRRTKLNELNYIDHPVYGALMKITEITPEPGANASNDEDEDSQTT